MNAERLAKLLLQTKDYIVKTYDADMEAVEEVTGMIIDSENKIIVLQTDVD